MAEGFDAVLMDLQMPVMDGYEAVAELRKHGIQCPIIAMTAHAMKSERTRCLRVGFTEHISKPIDRPLLLRRLAELVGPPALRLTDPRQ